MADLIKYRLRAERLVERISEVDVQISNIGVFRAVSYRTAVDDLEHLALVKGCPAEDVPVLGRVHQESLLGDVFRCGPTPSRWRLEFALKQMEAAGCGVLVYLQKPAPRLSRELLMLGGTRPSKSLEQPVDKGSIGLPMDLREFGIGAQILLDQGVRQLRVITGSPQHIKGVEGFGLTIVDHIPVPPPPERYAQATMGPEEVAK